MRDRNVASEARAVTCAVRAVRMTFGAPEGRTAFQLGPDGPRRRRRRRRRIGRESGVKSYLVEFIVVQPRGSAVAVRQLLTKRLPWTRELAVAEADGVLKVRVSTERPELAVLTGVECGTLRDVVVESEVVKRAGG